MNMQASTVRLLEAANFTTPQALALAEAIDTHFQAMELVTIPIFNVRMGEFSARMDKFDKRMDGFEVSLKEMGTNLSLKISESENRLFTKVAALGLSAMTIFVTVVLFIVMNGKK